MSAPEEPATPRSALDGFRLGHLPDGLGVPSDFAYTWEDVDFAARVWESTNDAGSVVDLQVAIVRGERLGDVKALHSFMAEYHEKDPVTWATETFTPHGQPGFRSEVQAVWLVEPGVAVSVKIDRERFTDADLVDTACGVDDLRAERE